MFGYAKSKAQLEQMKKDYLENLAIEVNNSNILATRQRAKDEGIPPIPPQYKTEKEILEDTIRLDNELVQTLINEFDLGYSKADKIKNAFTLDEKVKILALFPSFKSSLLKDAKKGKLRLLDEKFIIDKIRQFLSSSSQQLLGLNYISSKNTLATLSDLKQLIPSQEKIKELISLYRDEPYLREELNKLENLMKIVPSKSKLDDISNLPSTKMSDIASSLTEVYQKLNLPSVSDIDLLIKKAIGEEDLISGETKYETITDAEIKNLFSNKLSSLNRRNLEILANNIEINTNTSKPLINILNDEIPLDINFSILEMEGETPQDINDIKQGYQPSGQLEAPNVPVNDDRLETNDLSENIFIEIENRLNSLDYEELSLLRDDLQSIVAQLNSPSFNIKNIVLRNNLIDMRGKRGTDAKNIMRHIIRNFISNGDIDNSSQPTSTLNQMSKFLLLKKQEIKELSNLINQLYNEKKPSVIMIDPTEELLNELPSQIRSPNSSFAPIRQQTPFQSPSSTPSDFRSVASRPPSEFDEIEGSGMRRRGRGVSLNRQTAGTSALLEGKTRDTRGVYNPQKPSLNQKTGGRISLRKLIGKGVSIEEQPRYKEFGKYVINYHNLMNGVANFKYPSLGGIREIKAKTISDDCKDLLIDILENDRLNERMYNKLDDDEQQHLYKVFKGAGLLERFKIQKKETDEDINDIDRFNLLRGSYIAGNNSENVIKELRGLIVKFIKQERITKKEGMTMLMEII